MISINGLTKAQVALLDEMWACETFQEFEDFLETLDPAEREEAIRLQYLVCLEGLDDDMKNMTDYPDARKILHNVMSK